MGLAVHEPGDGEEAEAAVGDGLRADIGQLEVADEASLGVDADVRDPRRGRGVAVGLVGLAVVLKIDEDLLGAALGPVLDDVLQGLGGAVLLVVAVREIADRADLDVLDDLAGLDLAVGQVEISPGEAARRGR